MYILYHNFLSKSSREGLLRYLECSKNFSPWNTHEGQKTSLESQNKHEIAVYFCPPLIPWKIFLVSIGNLRQKFCLFLILYHIFYKKSNFSFKIMILWSICPANSRDDVHFVWSKKHRQLEVLEWFSQYLFATGREPEKFLRWHRLGCAIRA